MVPTGAGRAQADIQNADQRRCLQSMLRSAAKVERAKRKDLASCIVGAGRGSVKKGDTAAGCVAIEGDKVLKALAGTRAEADKRCVDDVPDFGFVGADPLNDALLTSNMRILEDIFGSDLDAAIVLESDSKGAAKCQAAVTKAYGRVLDERARVFSGCVAEGLLTGGIQDTDGVADCVAAIDGDPRGGIAKALSKLTLEVIKRCTPLSGVPSISGVLPGDACADAPDIVVCLESRMVCHTCVAANAAHGMAANCDLLDDGAQNGSCFDENANECAGENGGNLCDLNASCTDLDIEPGYDCSCDLGFSGDGFECLDDDECAGEGAGNNCDVNATCLNEPASFSCTCNAGYDGDGVTCVDIDECTLGTDNCHATLATCENTDGAFTCDCIEGYDGDGVTCDDVDECSLGTDNCHTNALCTNEIGSFSCACASGFSGDGVDSCTDLNECAGENGGNNCDANATCGNIPGSFTCTCNSGWSGTGTICSDVDECATDKDNCSEFATCTNSLGGFSCACLSGFSGDGVTCVDLNECAGEGSGNNCSVNATCANEPGTFKCTCNSGYGGDGVSCIDFDECAGEGGGNNCDANATCTNSLGSFSCACDSGFFGSGVSCTDYNECAGQNGGNNCSTNAVCINQPGDFTCECSPGFLGNPFGSTCNLIEVELTSPTHGTFTQGSSIATTGVISPQPVPGDVTLTVNGSPVAYNASNGTFSTNVSLSAVEIFNGILAKVSQASTGYSVQDRRVAILGDSVATGAQLAQSTALRINDSGFDALGPILTAGVPLDPSSLIAPGTAVIQDECFQDTFLGCAASATVRLTSIALNPTTPFGLDIDSMTNFIAGDVFLYDLDVKVSVDITIIGFINTDCPELRFQSTVTTIAADYTLEPDPGDPNVIDVNQSPGSLSVNLGGFNQTANCGGIGFVSAMIDLVAGNLSGTLESALVDTLDDPDGSGPQDAFVAQAIEDALAAIELTGPLGDGFGVDLQTPLFAIPEDTSGITLASGSIITPQNPDPGSPQFARTLELPTVFPFAQLGGTVPGTGTSYDLGIALSDSAFNQILAAMISSGLLSLELTEIPDLTGGGGAPQPLTAGLFCGLGLFGQTLNGQLTAGYCGVNPLTTLTLRIVPTLAPALTGNTGAGGEIAELDISHLRIEIFEGVSGVSEVLHAALAVDLRSAFDLVVGSVPGGGVGLIPNIGVPAADDIDLVLLENPLLLDEDLVKDFVPVLLTEALPGLVNVFPPIALPQFLGLVPTPVDVVRTGPDFIGIYLNL